MNMERFAQMAFLQNKPLFSLATGYTGCDINIERELDLSALIYDTNESEVAYSEDVGVLASTQEVHMVLASSTRSQQLVVQTDAGPFEDARGSVQEVNSSALHEADRETVKGLSDDGHSYAGTVVRGVLRGDSE